MELRGSRRTGHAYLGARPSRKRVKRVCQAISQLTGRDRTLLDVEAVVTQLNQVLVGWAHYFSPRLGPLTRTYDAVDAHSRRRLRQWLGRKYKQRGTGGLRYADTYLHETLGLQRLRGFRVGVSNATA